MEPDTAGSPTGKTLRWCRKSTYNISAVLQHQHIKLCPNSAGKILKQLDYSLKLNRKSISETRHPERDLQFQQINARVNSYEDREQPIISNDTKKKELIGNFRNPGRKYDREFENTLTHDFRSAGMGMANPYGIYEKRINKGLVVIGNSKDTPEFAVAATEIWLTKIGFNVYSDLKTMLILCDSGGSNGYRVNGWKYFLYHNICKVYGIEVDVCHYPTGASKWNPIEHKMFCHVSKNWAGVPLRTYEIMMNYINTTSTEHGLTVMAVLHDKQYQSGLKFTKEQMNSIHIKPYDVLPQWNYKIVP
jgi:hypothetical protein